MLEEELNQLRERVEALENRLEEFEWELCRLRSHGGVRPLDLGPY